MQKLFRILCLILMSFGLKAQVQLPSTLPSPSAPAGYIREGYVRAGAFIFVERDTFCAKYPTLIKHINHNFYYTNGNCGPWFPIVSSSSTFIGIDSITYANNNLCQWKGGVSTCYTVVTPASGGVDSVTYVGNQLCQWIAGVSTCYTINGNTLATFVDSVVVGGDQLCQWISGVSTCYTISTGGGTNQRLGIEDNLGVQDRSVDMGGFGLSVQNAANGIDLGANGTSPFNANATNSSIAAYPNLSYINAYDPNGDGTGITSDYRGIGLFGNFVDTAYSFMTTTLDTSSKWLAVTPTRAAIITNGGTARDVAISVNGNYADNTGNITIASGAATDTTSLSNRINLKQNLITLTTTGSSGASTFNQGTGALNIPTYAAGTGTVTSVAMTMPGVLFNTTVSGSPITTSGTLAPSLISQSAYTNFGNNTSGSATPTFFTNNFSDSLRRVGIVVSRRVNGLWIPQYNDSTGAGGTGWLTTGNAIIPQSGKFLGTTDSSSLRFRTNNIQRGYFDSLGKFYLNDSYFDFTTNAKLLTFAANNQTLSISGGATAYLSLASTAITAGPSVVNNYILGGAASSTSPLIATKFSNYTGLYVGAGAYSNSVHGDFKIYSSADYAYGNSNTTAPNLYLYSGKNTFNSVYGYTYLGYDGTNKTASVGIGGNIKAGAVATFNATREGVILPKLTTSQRDSLYGTLAITLTAGGTGYTSNPSVVFTDGGGIGAVGTTTLSGTAVNSLTLGQSGYGWVTAPTISFTGGGGSGATATATVTKETGVTIFCTDCTAIDTSTGVNQTWNGSTWKSWW